MSKYISIFKISFAQETAYRANFLMWRVRNILQFILVFFLWDAAFNYPGKTIFGYTQDQIVTYIFGLLIVRAVVLSSRSTEVAGEIARGDLSNYLVKPMSYIKYWWTRDVSSKALNIIFASVEFFILYLIIRPNIFFQTDPIYITGFLISLGLAVVIYFLLLFITSSVPFWWPENAWGAHFLLTAIFVEFLSGAIFPLDILPQQLLTLLSYTPFPYLVYFPIEIYLGKVEYAMLLKGLIVSIVWIVFLYYLMKRIWGNGLRVYQSHGR